MDKQNGRTVVTRGERGEIGSCYLMGTEFQDDGARTRLQQIAEANKTQIEQQKLQLTRQQMQADLYNKAADRAVKMEDIKSKERIAKTNKNKYDK